VPSQPVTHHQTRNDDTLVKQGTLLHTHVPQKKCKANIYLSSSGTVVVIHGYTHSGMYSACTLSFLSSCVTVVPRWSLMHGSAAGTQLQGRRSSLACNGTSASCPVESSQGRRATGASRQVLLPARLGLHGLTTVGGL
jgi:hypothetical protein